MLEPVILILLVETLLSIHHLSPEGMLGLLLVVEVGPLAAASAAFELFLAHKEIVLEGRA